MVLIYRIDGECIEVEEAARAEVVGDFNVRGGIKTEVRAVYGKRPALDA